MFVGLSVCLSITIHDLSIFLNFFFNVDEVFCRRNFLSTMCPVDEVSVDEVSVDEVPVDDVSVDEVTGHGCWICASSGEFLDDQIIPK